MNGTLKWVLGGVATFLGTVVLALSTWNFTTLNALQMVSSGSSYNITEIHNQLVAIQQLTANMQTTITALQITNGVLDNRLATAKSDIDAQRLADLREIEAFNKKIDDVKDSLGQILVRLGAQKR